MNTKTLRSEYQISSRLKHSVCWTGMGKIMLIKVTNISYATISFLLTTVRKSLLQNAHGWIHCSLLCPVELQFEQVTLWSLGSCAPLSLRYSSLLSCNSALSFWWDVAWKYYFVTASLNFSNPHCLYKWYNTAVNPHEFSCLVRHCMDVLGNCFCLINLRHPLSWLAFQVADVSFQNTYFPDSLIQF